jgi:acetyl esterase/lipase
MRGTLSPKLESFIEQVNAAIAQAKADGVVANPQLAREKLAALSAFVTKVPDVEYVKDKHLETDTHSIPVKVYSPAMAEALPVVIFFHGGGHMCGDTELYDPMTRKIALASKAVVISVDYRLAPEFPYPAGLDDGEYVVKHYREILTDVAYNDSLIIAGDSGGGAICASLTMRKVSDPTLKFDKQVLIYPSVDYTMSLPSIDDNGTGYFLEKARVQWYFDNYFLNGEDRKQASALFGPMNRESPTTLVLVAGCDPLRDEGLAYAEKLSSHGVHVETYSFDDMIHAFMNIEDLVPQECDLLFEKIGAFVNS